MSANFEALVRQLELSNQCRKGYLAQLKHSFEFELENTPKLKNMLFQEILKRKTDKDLQKSSKP